MIPAKGKTDMEKPRKAVLEIILNLFRQEEGWLRPFRLLRRRSMRTKAVGSYPYCALLAQKRVTNHLPSRGKSFFSGISIFKTSCSMVFSNFRNFS